MMNATKTHVMELFSLKALSGDSGAGLRHLKCRICKILLLQCRSTSKHPRKPASRIAMFTLQQPFYPLCVPFVTRQTLLLPVAICFHIWLPQSD